MKKNKDEIKQIIEDTVANLIGVLALISMGLLFCWLVSSCKHVEYVEVETETVKRDSIYLVRELHDSIYVRDSISVEPLETQTIVTKWHTEYKYVTKTDTAYINKVDTVYQTIKEKAEKSASNGFNWWKTAFWILIVLIVGYVIFYIARCFKII